MRRKFDELQTLDILYPDRSCESCQRYTITGEVISAAVCAVP
jgi:hypothetical protein